MSVCYVTVQFNDVTINIETTDNILTWGIVLIEIVPFRGKVVGSLTMQLCIV